MISKNPAESQVSPAPAAQAGTAGSPVPAMDPGSIIEAASSGDGTTGTPGANDNKPPGIGDQDPLFQLLG
jgi:hypothetical protein